MPRARGRGSSGVEEGGPSSVRPCSTTSSRRRRVEGHFGVSIPESTYVAQDSSIVASAHSPAFTEHPSTTRSHPSTSVRGRASTHSPAFTEHPSTTRSHPCISVRGRQEDPSTSGHEEDPSSELPSEQDISGPFSGGPEDASILKSFKNHVALDIWDEKERDLLRCRGHGLRISEWPLTQQRIRVIVEQSCLASLIGCTYRFMNSMIVTAFSERWQPETNTFHMPFGEMTILLDDVAALLMIPIQGNPVFVSHLTSDEAHELLCRLLGISALEATRQIVENRSPFVKLDWLRQTFMNVSDSALDEEIIYASR